MSLLILLAYLAMPVGDAQPIIYTYDAAGRLTSIVTSFDQWGGTGLVYRYDNAGNILEKSIDTICFSDQKAVLAAVSDWPNTPVTQVVATVNLPCE